MKKVLVTGATGFIGTHMVNRLALHPEKYNIVSMGRADFESEGKLEALLEGVDVIVHLAGVNRSANAQELYDTNIELSKCLVDALGKINQRPHIIVSSSTQENRDNIYGISKREARLTLYEWANKMGASFTGLIIPNVFGPFSKPFYNTVIATFCHQLINNQLPVILEDSEVNLIYVDDLISTIIDVIESETSQVDLFVKANQTILVSQLLEKLTYFYESYFKSGVIPVLLNAFDYHLFNTFRSFIDIDQYFPRVLIEHKDDRGVFVELARLGIGGQVSFSTTVPNITRGNHFHTRKIERFAVISGKARLEFRRFRTDLVHIIEIDASKAPAYVDIPIWYTHNITNVGEQELYTVFWINEPYDPNNPDTYFEIV